MHFADFSQLGATVDGIFDGSIFEGLSLDQGDSNANDGSGPSSDEWVPVVTGSSHSDALAALSSGFSDYMTANPSMFDGEQASTTEGPAVVATEWVASVAEEEEEVDVGGPATTLAGPSLDLTMDDMRGFDEVIERLYETIRSRRSPEVRRPATRDYVPPRGVMTFEEMLVKREVQQGLRCGSCEMLLDAVLGGCVGCGPKIGVPSAA